MRTFRKLHLLAAFWGHCPIVVWPIRHSLYYKGWFSMTTFGWQTFQITPTLNWKPLTISKEILGIINMKLLSDVIFFWYPDKLMFHYVRWPVFNKIVTPRNQTSQIIPNWSRKPVGTSQNFLKNFSLSCCMTSFFYCCPAKPTFHVLHRPVFN